MNLTLEPQVDAAFTQPRPRPNRSHRIFWTTQGWFIRLRDSDARHAHGMSRRYPDVRVIGSEVVAGPFVLREHLVDWFDAFTEMHPDHREYDDPTMPPVFTF